MKKTSILSLLTLTGFVSTYAMHPTKQTANSIENNQISTSYSPDGRTVAIADRNTNKVKIFSVNDDGSLTLLSTHSAVPNPLSVEYSEDGSHLKVTDQNTDTVSTYRINDDGSLTFVDTFDAQVNTDNQK